MPEEEVKEEVKEEEVKEEVKEETPDELTEVQRLAKEIGWNPNHEEGDRKFKTAEEYILGSKDIQTTQTKQNKSLKREVEDLKTGINMLQRHNDTVYKVQVKALKSRVRELEGRRKEALEDGDAEAVSAIDGQIREINDIPESLPVEQIQSVPPEFEEWAEKNSWYKDNAEMRAYADKQGQVNPEVSGLPFPKFLKEVTKLVKSKFPENFEQPKRTPRAAAVEPVSQSRKADSSKSKYTYSELSRTQQDACDFFVKQGIMTQEQYIKELEIIEADQGRV